MKAKDMDEVIDNRAEIIGDLRRMIFEAELAEQKAAEAGEAEQAIQDEGKAMGLLEALNLIKEKL